MQMLLFHGKMRIFFTLNKTESFGKTNSKVGLISPTLNEQLLYLQIPKAQKDTHDLTVFCTYGI